MSRIAKRRAAPAAAMVAAILAGTAIGFWGQAVAHGQAPAQGQRPATATPPPPPGTIPPGEVIVGAGQVTPILVDREKSVEFYGNLVKLIIPPTRGSAPAYGAFGSPAGLMRMVGMPNTWTGILTGQPEVRFVMTRIPGSAMQVELEEFRHVDRVHARPKPQDPGAVTLILLVRDINAAFTPLKQAGVNVVTTGGAPIALDAEGGTRGVLFTDPDGHYIELLQADPLPATNAPPDSNLIGAKLRLTVADTDKTLAFYRDALKMPVAVGAFSEDPLAELMGIKGAQVRVTNAKIPGSALRLEFVEVKGVDRTPMTSDLNDPGSVRFTLRVKDVDSLTPKAVAAGGTIVSTGGATVTLGGGNRYIVVRDPDNLLVQFVQSPPPAR